MTEIADAAEGPDTRTALLRHAASVVILVALVSASFWAIGSLDADDRAVEFVAERDTPRETDQPEDALDDDVPEEDVDDGARVEPEADADATDEDSEASAEVPEADGSAEPDPAEGATADDADDNGDEEEVADTDADAAAEEGTAGDEAAEDEAAEEDAAEPAPALAPGDVTVQVLDGYKSDGGTAARRVAQQLRDGGYRIIAENQALTYPTTTVFWTSGNEVAARQVAREIGAGDVRPQPGTLSEAVAVHVVVGADRG